MRWAIENRISAHFAKCAGSATRIVSRGNLVAQPGRASLSMPTPAGKIRQRPPTRVFDFRLDEMGNQKSHLGTLCKVCRVGNTDRELRKTWSFILLDKESRAPSNEQRAPSTQQPAPSNQQRAPSNQQRAPSNQQRGTSNQQRGTSDQEGRRTYIAGRLLGFSCFRRLRASSYSAAC